MNIETLWSWPRWFVLGLSFVAKILALASIVWPRVVYRPLKHMTSTTSNIVNEQNFDVQVMVLFSLF